MVGGIGLGIWLPREVHSVFQMADDHETHQLGRKVHVKGVKACDMKGVIRKGLRLLK
jgi:hypothetical protein